MFSVIASVAACALIVFYIYQIAGVADWMESVLSEEALFDIGFEYSPPPNLTPYLIGVRGKWAFMIGGILNTSCSTWP